MPEILGMCGGVFVTHLLTYKEKQKVYKKHRQKKENKIELNCLFMPNNSGKGLRTGTAKGKGYQPAYSHTESATSILNAHPDISRLYLYINVYTSPHIHFAGNLLCHACCSLLVRGVGRGCL